MKCYNYFPYMQAMELINKQKYVEAYNILCTLYVDEQNSNIIKNELILLTEKLRQEKLLTSTELLEKQVNKIGIKKYSLT